MRSALALLLVASAFAGCLSFSSVPPCPDPEGWFLAGPRAPDGSVPAFGEEEPDYERILVFGTNPTQLDASLLVTFEHEGKDVGHGSKTQFNDVTTARGPNATLIGGLTPSFAAEYATDDEWRYDLQVRLIGNGGCDGLGTFDQSETFTRTAPSQENAYAGIGANVRTAGFWHNGTLFYTNIASVHADPRYAHAGWYEYEGDDPLPVYVYNETRTELPPRYNESGFVTTIPGFNEALKGMMVGASRVAGLTPAEAYTRPGNENHALYGDPIVFYIELVDVEARPCPLPQPVCEVPTAPAPTLGSSV